MWDKEFLIEKLTKDLPGEKAHYDFYPYRNQHVNATEATKQAAVGIHLFFDQGVCYFFLIKRAVYQGHHSGQIAFPGGKSDPTDIDLIHTSRRESFEELGILLTLGEYIRTLTPVYIPVSNFKVHPIVFLHMEKPEIKNNHEVENVFEISINELIEIKNTSKINIETNGMKLKNIPAFQFEECQVWGATALILNELKEMFN